MSTLGFDRYVEPLKIYLAKYRDSVRGDRPEKKGGDEYGAQPKLGGSGGGGGSVHGGSASLGGVSDAPIFSFDSTSGVMVSTTELWLCVIYCWYERSPDIIFRSLLCFALLQAMMPDYRPPSMAPGKNEVSLCLSCDSCASVYILNLFTTSLIAFAPSAPTNARTASEFG